MKTKLFCFILSCFLFTNLAFAKEKTAPIKLTLKTTQKVYLPSELIDLKIKVENISKKDFEAPGNLSTWFMRPCFHICFQHLKTKKIISKWDARRPASTILQWYRIEKNASYSFIRSVNPQKFSHLIESLKPGVYRVWVTLPPTNYYAGYRSNQLIITIKKPNELLSVLK